MLYNPPNFLVLDEPTNHLDLATKEMLMDALKDFEGTMIFVSHDRMFLRGLGSRVLELGGESGTDRNPTVYPGSYVETCKSLDMRPWDLFVGLLRRLHDLYCRKSIDIRAVHGNPLAYISRLAVANLATLQEHP
ncbi:MAG: hypothetical protein WB729_08170 [Candidatus Sulfotelmatobacter sp.]